MTSMINITATKRSKTDSLAEIRKNGRVPAVVYGASVENTPISVPSSDFVKVFKEAGESSAIMLDVGGKKIDVLIHEVQADPIRGFPVHVDFLAIDVNKAIEVAVPLEFEGVSAAVKGGLGSLVKVLHEVEIMALPKELPHSLHVDISKLATLDDQIHVADIMLPVGVVMMTGADEVVALVAAAKEEKEEAAPADLSAIEVEKKGKKEEEAPAGESKE